MKNRNFLASTSVLILVGALLAVGCGEAERIFDCAQICDKYSDCIDDSIDKTDCVNDCEDHGDDDQDFADQASDCEDCLDSKECTEATVECGTKCAAVVASST